MRGGHVAGEAAQQGVAGAAEDLPDDVPDREVDRAARDVVARDAGAARGDELDPQRVDAAQRRGERPADRGDDRGLRLAVVYGRGWASAWPTSPASVCTRTSTLSALAHASGRELRRAPVGQRERDRLDRRDPDRARACDRIVRAASRHRRQDDASGNTNQVLIDYVLNMNPTEVNRWS